jgi:hypothetical protein
MMSVAIFSLIYWTEDQRPTDGYWENWPQMLIVAYFMMLLSLHCSTSNSHILVLKQEIHMSLVGSKARV